MCRPATTRSRRHGPPQQHQLDHDVEHGERLIVGDVLLRLVGQEIGQAEGRCCIWHGSRSAGYGRHYTRGSGGGGQAADYPAGPGLRP